MVRPLDDGRPLTLAVSGEQVTGSSGVNRFTGTLGQVSVFSTLAITKMAGPEEFMAQEGIFLAHLESADSIETSGSGILLLSGELVVLTLVPSGTASASTTS